MWLLPTYRRPSKCGEVLKAINYVGVSSPGLVLVNGTDDEKAYRALKLPPGWMMEILPVNIGLCGAMNWTFHHYPNEPFYGLICDDEYVYTTGWDQRLIEAADTKYIAHGNDKWQSGKRMHAYVTWGGDLLRQIGWWALPGLWHWFHDDAWEQIASGLNIVKFCEDVYCEHKHYLAGKAEKDKTYLAGESRMMNDRQVYQAWLLTQYPELKRKLPLLYQDKPKT